MVWGWRELPSIDGGTTCVCGRGTEERKREKERRERERERKRKREKWELIHSLNNVTVLDNWSAHR